MKWRLLRWTLLGIVVYLVAVAVSVPATYLSTWIGRRYPSIRVVAPDGTVFSGQSGQVWIGSEELGQLAWEPDWLAPFTGTLGYRLRLTGPGRAIHGRLDSRFSTVFLRSAQGELPVAALDAWLPFPSGSVSGQLNLTLKEVTLRNGRITDGTGEVHLSQLGLTWPENLSLGDFDLVLQPTGGKGLQGHIADAGGPLQADLAVSLSPEGIYHVTGSIAARAGADASLRKMLTYLGEPGSDGRYPVNFDGHW